jgi:hypothetical protein
MKILANLVVMAVSGSSSGIVLARSSPAGVREDESADQHRYVERELDGVSSAL